jgi:hypothetical protein
VFRVADLQVDFHSNTAVTAHGAGCNSMRLGVMGGRAGQNGRVLIGGARDEFDELEDARDAEHSEDLDNSDDPRVADQHCRHVPPRPACLQHSNTSASGHARQPSSLRARLILKCHDC